jgi:peroxiredoxin Q/BCP
MNLTLRMLALAAGSLVFSAQAALGPGESAPAFTAPSSLAGKPSPFSLRDALSKGPVVVYFYPSAYTNGCNLQAHLFSVNSERIAAAGASVVGVSLDSIQRLNEFSADPQFCAGKLRVVSDGDGSIAKSFGLAVKDIAPGKKDTRGAEIDHATVERATFIVNPDGRIAATVSGVSAADNVAKTLEQVEALQARK